MAKITTSPIITSISGSVGQATFRRNGSSHVLSQKCRNEVKSNDSRQAMLEKYRASQLYVKSVNEWVVAQAFQLLTLFPKYQGGFNSIEKNVNSYLSNFLFYRHLMWGDYFYEIEYHPEPLWPSIYKVIRGSNSLYLDLIENEEIVFGAAAIFASNRSVSPVTYKNRYTSYMKSVDLTGDHFNFAPEYISRFGVLPSIGQYVCITLVCFDTDTGHISSDITQWVQVTAS